MPFLWQSCERWPGSQCQFLLAGAVVRETAVRLGTTGGMSVCAAGLGRCSRLCGLSVLVTRPASREILENGEPKEFIITAKRWTPMRGIEPRA